MLWNVVVQNWPKFSNIEILNLIKCVENQNFEEKNSKISKIVRKVPEITKFPSKNHNFFCLNSLYLHS